ncbi:DUF6624 domain-containing protein [Duganella callida]|uniref:Uncharacterized protein n=1 Tax=Duganella callida TaxID=2561932 RepID=A0A4Y9SDC4_9BURK|nr:DUF6624 domain-containing protein [Duganella callida]TFW20720.1 hypothetical protein E4L98_14630 [Duganella callida]
MRTIFLLALLLATASAHAAPTQPALRAELLAMRDADQAVRQHFDPQKGYAEADLPNLKRLKEIVGQYGWPTVAMVDQDGADAAWLLAQHADRDIKFQRQVLELMQPLIAQGQASLKNYAYLYDRTHDPQRYGTQGQCVSREEWQPFEVEDPAGLAKRRTQAGLIPMEQYLAGFKPICADSYDPNVAAVDRKAMLSEAADVSVGDGGIQVARTSLRTPEELLAFIQANKILKVRLHIDSPAADYETIGKVIYGLQRAGVMLEFVETGKPDAG